MRSLLNRTKAQNLILIIALLGASSLSIAQKNSDVPSLILLAAHSQEQAMAVRDRTRYEQELTVHRYALNPAQSAEAEAGKESSKRLGERTTVVSVAPSPTVDEQGRREVLVRIVSDTDDQGNPRSHIDPKGQPGLLVEVLWDELFFPLQEEKLPFLTFESIPSDDPLVAQYRFEPKVQARTMILASGLVLIDATTGSVKSIWIQSLHNLQSLHKQLAKLESISAQIQFEPFRGVWSLPASATGQGVSHLHRLEGLFQFKYREWGHEPVLKIPDAEPTQF